MAPLGTRRTPNDAPTYCGGFFVCFLSLTGREHLRHKTKLHWTTAPNETGSLDYTDDIYNDTVSSTTRRQWRSVTDVHSDDDKWTQSQVKFWTSSSVLGYKPTKLRRLHLLPSSDKTEKGKTAIWWAWWAGVKPVNDRCSLSTFSVTLEDGTGPSAETLWNSLAWRGGQCLEF